jgi:uncharacterized protein
MRPVPIELNGARVLLTGASGGIGNAIARALHARGASLAITGRRVDALEALKDELGDRIEVLVADLAKREDVEGLPIRAGTVDVLVANAGLPGSGELGSFTPEQLDRAIDVNLRAPMQLARELAPRMRERGAGHLVFVSSISGKVAQGGASIYSATKFGLRGFAFALRDELHGSGVGVTTVFPGFIRDAGMFADSGVKLPAGVGTRSPEHVAAAVVRGIERNRGEIDVAPFSFRFGGWLFGGAPELVTRLTRAGGSAKVSQALAEGQRDKR